MADFPKKIWLWRDRFHYLNVAQTPVTDRDSEEYVTYDELESLQSTIEELGKENERLRKEKEAMRVAWHGDPKMITEPKKRQLEDVMFGGAFIRLKDNTKFPRVWLSENGTYFPYENGWFIEGWGEFYSHDQYEQNPNVIVVGTMQVPSLGGLNPEELSYIAQYNGIAGDAK